MIILIFYTNSNNNGDRYEPMNIGEMAHLGKRSIRRWRRRKHKRKYAPKIMTLNHKWLNLFDCYRSPSQWKRKRFNVTLNGYTYTERKFSTNPTSNQNTTHHHTHTHSPLHFNRWISFYFSRCNFYSCAHISHFYFFSHFLGGIIIYIFFIVTMSYI